MLRAQPTFQPSASSPFGPYAPSTSPTTGYPGGVTFPRGPNTNPTGQGPRTAYQPTAGAPATSTSGGMSPFTGGSQPGTYRNDLIITEYADPRGGIGPNPNWNPMTAVPAYTPNPVVNQPFGPGHPFYPTINPPGMGTPQTPGGQAPNPQTTNPQTPGAQQPGTQQPGTQQPGGQSGGIGAANDLASLLAQIPPLNLPTRQSQNQLMALTHQQANPVQAMNRLGNNGIQTGSGVNAQRLMGPMMQTLQQGALGAANLGLDDQLLRDKHTLTGLVGLGGLENDRLRAGARRDRIGLDAQQQYLDAIIQLLGGFAGNFNLGNLTDSFGDIAGAF